MTPIAWLYIALVVLPLAFLVWQLITSDRKALAAVQGNLGQGMAASASFALQRPPALQVLVRRATPAGYIARLDHWLSMAGRPQSMPLDRLLMAKPALAVAGALLGMLLVAGDFSPRNIALLVFVTIFLYFLPDLLVFNQGTKRQEAIEQELPNTLDQMLISVEAGLGFESAMARAAQQGGGPLAQELIRTLQDIQVGRPRQEAYQALANRCTVQDLKSFVRAVIQADKYGVPIAKVLRTQAKISRVKRRQRAEEKALKLPVKILFPLILCIFPVLFIVLLGPAVINVIAAFS